MPEPRFSTDDLDDLDWDTDGEVAQHTDGASEGDQYDQSVHQSTGFSISEYQLLHRAVFSPAEGTEELRQLLDKGTDVDCTDHAGSHPPDLTGHLGTLHFSCCTN